MSSAEPKGVRLVVERSIRATPPRLFDAWTRPSHLEQWWGQPGVVCIGAEVDLRPGGAYRIGNRFDDGRELWISGRFEAIEPPHRLVYTWQTAPDQSPERVTVTFEARGDLTDVVIVHERIHDQRARDGHEVGWRGCLDGLETYVQIPAGQNPAGMSDIVAPTD